jgi:hypothetical protein
MSDQLDAILKTGAEKARGIAGRNARGCLSEDGDRVAVLSRSARAERFFGLPA